MDALLEDYISEDDLRVSFDPSYTNNDFTEISHKIVRGKEPGFSETTLPNWPLSLIATFQVPRHEKK